MSRGYDWPSEGHRATHETILTAAGLDDLIRDLPPQSVVELKRLAHEMRMGQRSVSFPEVGRGAGAHLPGSRSAPGSRDAINGIMGGLSPMRRVIANWFRTIAESPRGMAGHFAQDETVKRVLGEAGQSEGGYLIPPGFISELVMDAVPLNFLQPWVRTIPVGLPTGTLPLEAAAPAIYWGTENTDISEGDPAFSDVPWTVHRMNGISKMSREVADDSQIVEYVTTLFQRCIIEERDRVIAVGSGSGQPTGLYSASGIYDTGITTLSYDNLVKLKYSIDMRYHGLRSFRWTMNQTVLENILEIVDSMGRPIFNNAIAGAPPTILGVPFSISNSFPNSYIGIGALEFYILFDRQQVTVEQTTEGGDAFQAHQRWIKIILRLDGKPAIPPTPPLARSTVLTGIS